MERVYGGVEGAGLGDKSSPVAKKGVRERSQDGATAHAASGPDDQGRVVYVENRMAEKRHTFRVIRIDGSGDRVLLERKGDALWERSVGMMALAPTGGTLAFVDAPTARNATEARS